MTHTEPARHWLLILSVKGKQENHDNLNMLFLHTLNNFQELLLLKVWVFAIKSKPFLYSSAWRSLFRVGPERNILDCSCILQKRSYLQRSVLNLISWFYCFIVFPLWLQQSGLCCYKSFLVWAEINALTLQFSFHQQPSYSSLVITFCPILLEKP